MRPNDVYFFVAATNQVSTVLLLLKQVRPCCIVCVQQRRSCRRRNFSKNVAHNKGPPCMCMYFPLSKLFDRGLCCSIACLSSSSRAEFLNSARRINLRSRPSSQYSSNRRRRGWGRGNESFLAVAQLNPPFSQKLTVKHNLLYTYRAVNLEITLKNAHFRSIFLGSNCTSIPCAW